MIRRMEEKEINQVAEIWLDTNIKAHDFIPETYWRKNLEYVKTELKKAEIYVYEDKEKMIGFVGLNNGYIEGIFVKKENQSKGMGGQLLTFCKQLYSELTLAVYQKNSRAIQFYQKEGFKIIESTVDENTNEEEYIMKWTKL